MPSPKRAYPQIMRSLVKRVSGWNSSIKRTWMVTLIGVNWPIFATGLFPPFSEWTWAEMFSYPLALILISLMAILPVAVFLESLYKFLHWVLKDEESRKERNQ